MCILAIFVAKLLLKLYIILCITLNNINKKFCKFLFIASYKIIIITFYVSKCFIN